MRILIKSVVHFLCMIIFRVKKVGEKNIEKEGAYILCGNHVDYLDAPVVVLCTKRKVSFMAKEEAFKKWIIRYLGRVFDFFPVKRGKMDISAMKKSLKVLEEGGILGIFPEGTRHGMDKHAKIQNGAAYLALRTGVPVIPLGIQGTFKPFTKVKLNYGKPLDFSQYKCKNPEKDVLDKVSQEIMDSIIQLTKEEI